MYFIFLLAEMMVCWLVLFFLLNLVDQNHELETKSDSERGLSKSIPRGSTIWLPNR